MYETAHLGGDIYNEKKSCYMQQLLKTHKVRDIFSRAKKPSDRQSKTVAFVE